MTGGTTERSRRQKDPGDAARLCCLDVDYRGDHAVAACLVFDSWTAEREQDCLLARCAPLAPYEPGQFFRRELPCLLSVLERVDEPLAAIVVDGYVWLDGQGTAGLGGHLYRALGQRIPVVGVAKRAYGDSAWAACVRRGRSGRPLYVTAAGMPLGEARRRVAQMHGKQRLPTLLRRVDRACRQASADRR